MVNDSTNIITAKDISKKIKEKLEPTGWRDAMHVYLESNEFTSIFQKLIDKVQVEKQRFIPSFKYMMKPLEDINYDDVKVVVLVDYVNNKLEFSNERHFHEGMKESNQYVSAIFNSMGPITVSGFRWGQEGILVMPLALSCRLDGKAHKPLWQSFIIRLIETINKKHKGIPWVLIGADSFQYEFDIRSPHVRKVVVAGKQTDNQWTQWCNQVLKEQGKKEVIW